LEEAPRSGLVETSQIFRCPCLRLLKR
jgi:hypothetical protein